MGTHWIELEQTVRNLPHQFVLPQESDPIRTPQKRLQHPTSQSLKVAALGPLHIRIAMVERMQEPKQTADDLGTAHRLVQSLWVEKRTDEEIKQDGEGPFCRILG